MYLLYYIYILSFWVGRIKRGHLNPLHVKGPVCNPSMDSPFLTTKHNKSFPKEQLSQGVQPNLFKRSIWVGKNFLNHVRVGYRQPWFWPEPVQESFPVHDRPPVVKRNHTMKDTVVVKRNRLWYSFSVQLFELSCVPEDRTVARASYALISEVIFNFPRDPYEWVYEFQNYS